MNRYKHAPDHERAHPEELPEEEVRVTDRRRIRIDGEGQAAAVAPAEEPNLKPAP